VRRKKDPRGDLIVGRARTQGLNVERMSKKAGISLSTMYKRIRLPGTLTIDELQNIDKAVHFTTEEILLLVRNL
jgi:predicted transcriptional regulator